MRKPAASGSTFYFPLPVSPYSTHARAKVGLSPLLRRGPRGQRCGIELDAYRAAEAKQWLDQVIYGDCFDVECKVESFS